MSRVSRVIAALLPQYVKWPVDVDINSVKREFFKTARFPDVAGCIDCTHIKIKNPDGTNPLLYRCRKGFYSLNVQVVCGSQTRILDVVARWRGSAHDSRIWNGCKLKTEFEVYFAVVK